MQGSLQGPAFFTPEFPVMQIKADGEIILLPAHSLQDLADSFRVQESGPQPLIIYPCGNRVNDGNSLSEGRARRLIII